VDLPPGAFFVFKYKGEIMSLPQLLAQGGPVMYVLLAMSVLATAITLLKVWQFFRSGMRRHHFIDPTLAALRSREHGRAIQGLQDAGSPVARVMLAAVTCAADPGMRTADVEAEVGRVGSAEIRKLESYLRGLSAIAHLSPLLGLFGTVTGMIRAFMQVQQAGARVDASLLAGGIWEALLTTAFGLAVALPAMAIYYYLEGEVDRVRATMKDVSVRILVHFGRNPVPDLREGANRESEDFDGL
jgi:biopolymer transport protein ExbB